jgi:hypothetical protein
MLPTTYDAVKAVLKADQSILVAERNQMLAALRNGGSVAKPPVQSTLETAPRLLRRAEVARRLSISLRTVDKLPLKKFRLPGRSRSAGFLESDVNELLTGRELA